MTIEILACMTLLIIDFGMGFWLGFAVGKTSK